MLIVIVSLCRTVFLFELFARKLERHLNVGQFAANFSVALLSVAILMPIADNHHELGNDCFVD